MNNYKKMIDAGLKLFRLRELDKSIWTNRKGLAWTLWNRYPTAAEAKRKFNELMKDNKNVTV